MLRIRLRRVGKKKQPMYRIVVADSHAPRDGRFVEAIGQYHPLEEPSKIVLDEERARHWLGKGAQPSDRVSKILAIQGIAEIPEKLKIRIALGEQRAKDAQAEKAKAKQAAEAEPAAEATGEPSEASASAEAVPKQAAEASDEAKPAAEPEAETAESTDASSKAEASDSTDASAKAEASKEASDSTDASSKAEASKEASDSTDASAKS